MNVPGFYVSADRMEARLGCGCGRPEHGTVNHLIYDITDDEYLYSDATFALDGFSLKTRIRMAWQILRGVGHIHHDFMVNFEGLIQLGEWAKERAELRDKLLAERVAEFKANRGVTTCSGVTITQVLPAAQEEPRG